MGIKLIESMDEFERLVHEQEELTLLKHSLTCPISAAAKEEYDKFSDQVDSPLYILHVQESRELSNAIADKYNIKHESPQVLHFKDNKVQWHDSHHRITEQALLANHK
ncbi:bacillithiol system redox-active protein YtxJ [Aquibacillus kalidii]|uniref:bacillithiol system redox-active protein YtxJ n=1 Tax=Aquibacillus kalidii TaxID=2762597 RepID=UPI0016491E1C|nr:bacillithiol system redox-active protein YtxJ [Aquibacillus kalidii]